MKLPKLLAKFDPRPKQSRNNNIFRSHDEYELDSDNDNSIYATPKSSSKLLCFLRSFFRFLKNNATSSEMIPIPPSNPHNFNNSNLQLQHFSLPSTLIHYISFKSPYLWEKLLKTCKHFFFRYSIIPIHSLKFTENKLILYQRKWSPSTDEHFHLNIVKLQVINDLPFKLWIICRFEGLSPCQSNLPLAITSKIYRSDVTHIRLTKQALSFEQFKVISKNCKSCELNYVTIRYKNGSIVPLEVVVENLSKLESFEFSFFDYNFKCLTSNTIKNLIELLHSYQDLTTFKLKNLPEISDFDLLFDFIMNQHQIQFKLEFIHKISADFRLKLDRSVEKIKTDKAEHVILYGRYH